MTAQHTPGPWAVRDAKPINSTDLIITGGPDGTWPLASVAAKNERVGSANARLIAAAPDLVKELEQCALEAEEAANLIAPNFPRAADLFTRAAQRTRAAIAKAGAR